MFISNPFPPSPLPPSSPQPSFGRLVITPFRMFTKGPRSGSGPMLGQGPWPGPGPTFSQRPWTQTGTETGFWPRAVDRVGPIFGQI